MVLRARTEASPQRAKYCGWSGTSSRLLYSRLRNALSGAFIPRFSRHRPIASWPGRSEKENSTVSSFASSCSGVQDGTTKVSRGSKSKLSPPIVALPVPSTTE